ncbi:hypothetical protein LshimejAT787_0212460 [Lyophyllum shimeji]|uniref:Uncharacterized protein n=1 Tax=Lyophyllum shimeji TaxID=47721 RepID=A0A9P3ULS9_LYOSH|nr:hypothetical protein LshimejAT787_0212460 [Lyophyllum shimeji]
MARTASSGVTIDSMAYHYALNSSVPPSTPSPSSAAPSDLSGFDCNIGPSQSYEFHIIKQQHPGREQERDCGVPLIQFPPSPPPTNSDPKRHVPLPCVSANMDAESSESLPCLPAHMKHVALGLHAPLTPPPTLPTPTQALPPAESVSELSPIPKHDELELESSLIGLPSSSRSPGEDRTALFPLSPEWSTNGMSYSMPSPPSPPSPPFAYDSSLLPYRRNYSETFEYNAHPQDNHVDHGSRGDSADSPESPSQSRPILPPLDIRELSFYPKSAWSESPSSASDTDMDMEYDELELDLLHTPTSPPASPFLRNKLDFDLELESESESDDLMYDATYHQHSHSHPHPSPPLVHQIPFPHPKSNGLLPSLDIEIPSSPSSPSLRAFASLPTHASDSYDEDSFGSYDDDEEEPLPLHQHHLRASPPSPAPTLLSLPGADTDDDLLPADLASSPYPCPRGGAGADVDADVESTPTPCSPYGHHSSLLLMDDAPPRSPSPDLDPDAFDEHAVDEIDLIAGCMGSDPDVRRLVELRRKCAAAERAARAVEVALLEHGQGQGVQRRWEARRVRKRERERGREVGAMLRLKLFGEKGKEREKERLRGAVDMECVETEVDGEERQRRKRKKTAGKGEEKCAISSMEQLVAKMLLRRNDTSRSLVSPGRRPPIPCTGGKTHVSSPLVRHAALAALAGGDEDEHEHEEAGVSCTRTTSGGRGAISGLTEARHLQPPAATQSV